MSKTNEIEVVRINPIDDETEEVFLYREDPYVNEVKRAPKGLYKLGVLAGPVIQKTAEEVEG